MLRVVVIGSPGAGKSTFARKLRDLTGLPLYYLDMIWHKPDQTSISQEEFDARLDAILHRDRWILDGNYQRTLVPRLRACDTVFLLDFPLEVCLAGAASRIGKKREDLPWIEKEFDAEFRQWIVDFPREQLPQIYRLLSQYCREKDVVVFRSRDAVADYLEKLGEEIGKKSILTNVGKMIK